MVSDVTAVRVRRLSLWLFAAVALLLLLACVWVGIRGALAVQHLTRAQSGIAGLGGDLAAAAQQDPSRLSSLRDDASAAHELTSDVVWTAMSGLPWIGPQLHAVGAVAAAADDIGQGALGPLSDAAGLLDPAALAPQGGRFDLDALETLQAPAREAATAIARADARLDDIDTRQLVRPLALRVAGLQSDVETAADTVDGLSRAAQLVPLILGAEGPRTYLLLFQNNAELRSLGGIPGSIAQITTDAGAIAITAQASSRDFPEYTTPVSAVPDGLRSVTGNKPAEWIQDVTQATDFSVAAQLAAVMWERERGVAVDGVIAMDPVALSYLLTATGPIDLPSGDVLSSEGAVPLLLNEAYFRYPDSAQQDAFFAGAAKTVMDTLTAGATDPAALMTALSRAASERRLLVWSALPEEQQIMQGTMPAGGLPETDDDMARFGVFYNDGTGSKMDYYLNAETTLEWDVCAVDAAATMTVDLIDNAPPPEQLPDYITGGGGFGIPAGVMRVLTYIYLPEGWSLVSTDVPETSSLTGGVDSGRRVVIVETDLQSGDAARLTVTATGPEVSSVEAQVTPTINTADTQVMERTC